MDAITFHRDEVTFNHPINIKGETSHHLTYYNYQFELQNQIFNGEVFSYPGLHQLALEEKKDLIVQYFVKHYSPNKSLAEFLTHSQYEHKEVQFLLESLTIKAQTFHLKTPLYFHQLFGPSFPITNEVLKIKIDPNLDTPESIKKIIHHPLVKRIRLDGNKKWSLSQLTTFFTDLAPKELAKIDYIEDPCHDLEESILFCQTQQVKLALDEYLLPFLKDPFEQKDFLPTFILRPSTMGFFECLNIIENSKYLDIEMIISSSFEPPQLSIALLFLANQINIQKNNPTIIHGLSPLHVMSKKPIGIETTKNQIYKK